MRQGLALILSAPSGTGKTTTCRLLLKKLPDLKIAVSHTTRKIRNGEKEGLDYFFVTSKEFEEKINNNDFLEWARVHNFYYGTSLHSAEEHLNTGHDTLLELDVQGVETLRKMKYQGIYILILPPSIEEMKARLTKRGTDSEDRIKQRIETGKKEIKKYKMYDYVITNYVVEDTVNAILAILQAERVKVSNYRPTSPDIEALLQEGTD
ncbi:MAG: guanylate kinase [Nitrospinae bacterium CG22_combo_CG10-13_8_21_14_all_47_10]|nr:MAG: guanylate kinase [Nitrospinae bacterium CG22_combo_CG10-13_8_21_14_all_47_10]